MPHRAASKEKLTYVVLNGINPDSRDIFKIGFDEQGGIVRLVKEERDFIGVRSTTSLGSSSGPITEKVIKDYFERQGIPSEIYQQQILPHLKPS